MFNIKEDISKCVDTRQSERDSGRGRRCRGRELRARRTRRSDLHFRFLCVNLAKAHRTLLANSGYVTVDNRNYFTRCTYNHLFSTNYYCCTEQLILS